HVAKAQQNELLGDVTNLWMKTNNLLVEPALVGSVPSVKDGENGLIFVLGTFERVGEIGVPGGVWVLSNGRPRERKDDAGYEKPTSQLRAIPLFFPGGVCRGANNS